MRYAKSTGDLEKIVLATSAGGVPVTVSRYEGMIHPFLSLAGVIDTRRSFRN